jgi:hypothetical protein
VKFPPQPRKPPTFTSGRRVRAAAVFLDGATRPHTLVQAFLPPDPKLLRTQYEDAGHRRESIQRQCDSDTDQEEWLAKWQDQVTGRY